MVNVYWPIVTSFLARDTIIVKDIENLDPEIWLQMSNQTGTPDTKVASRQKKILPGKIFRASWNNKSGTIDNHLFSTYRHYCRHWNIFGNTTNWADWVYVDTVQCYTNHSISYLCLARKENVRHQNVRHENRLRPEFPCTRFSGTGIVWHQNCLAQDCLAQDCLGPDCLAPDCLAAPHGGDVGWIGRTWRNSNHSKAQACPVCQAQEQEETRSQRLPLCRN